MRGTLALVALICMATLSGCCCRAPYWGSTYAVPAPAPVYQQPYVPTAAPTAVNYCPCPCY